MKQALLVVDVQNDFCPGGALGVKDGDQVIEPANQLIEKFRQQGLPIFLTRDWHPANHQSFQENGGIWPAHCVAGTKGAEFHPQLKTPENARIISKATEVEKEAYSAFEGTDLAQRLQAEEIEELIILGLATDYCVKNSVQDAIKAGFAVKVVEEGIRAVNLKPDDGQQAIAEMQQQGAKLVRLAETI